MHTPLLRLWSTVALVALMTATLIAAANHDHSSAAGSSSPLHCAACAWQSTQATEPLQESLIAFAPIVFHPIFSSPAKFDGDLVVEYYPARAPPAA